MNRERRTALYRSYSVLIFALTALISGCGSSSSETDRDEIRTVEVYRVLEEEVRGELEGFGNLSFRSKADVTAAVDGTITALHCDEGDTVKKGQLLAEMSNIQLFIQREQAEASLVSAEAALELAGIRYREGKMNIESRLLSLEKSYLQLDQTEKELAHQFGILKNKRELYTLGGLAEEEMSSLELSYISSLIDIESLQKDIAIQNIGFRDEDILSYGLELTADPEERGKVLLDINTRSLLSEVHVAEARVRSAGTELESAEALLQEMDLRAPMDGIIGARLKEMGERVRADTQVFTIFDSSLMDVIIPVPEKIGVHLSPGQVIDISVDAVREARYEAVIRQIGPAVDAQSGNITIKAALENREGIFLPGMFIRFYLTYGHPRRTIRIPVEALVRRNGDSALIFQVKGNRAYPKNITITEHTQGMVEVTDGLDTDDLIIVHPSPLLREGEEVDVQ